MTTTNIRPILSPLMFCVFVVLGISGILLSVAPHGPGATILGIPLHELGDIHMYSGFAFIALGLCHITVNRKSLIGYLKKRKQP